MAQRFSAVMQAGRFERFGPDAFAGQVGQPITIVVRSGEPEQGTLVAAETRDDGREVLLTVEVPDGLVPVGLAGGLSLSPLVP